MLPVAIALNRFGLGARPSDSAPADARGWLVSQLGTFQPRPPVLASLPTRADVIVQLDDYRREVRLDRKQSPRVQPGAMTTGAAMPAAPPDPERRALRKQFRDDYLGMNAARLSSALTTDAPFVERLVHFWANHFAVSIDKFPVVGLAGLLEFEAIRPHVLGRFSDLLLAVEQHPAMLLYLDQVQSVGPNSPAVEMAMRRGGKKRGINENLGREIMELHTLGVRTGYTQADVTEFAKALTGWTVSGLAQGPFARFLGSAPAGDFEFAEVLHEPGARTIMGKRYAENGEGQARAVLLDLAANPATAKHIATKLARHFAGDDPPAAMVDRLTRAYLASGGDLPAVYRAIVESPEAWVADPVKFKDPWDWTVSSLRALDATQLQPRMAAGLLDQLGQPTWKPGSPAGYDDVAASWAAPEALMLRVDVAQRLAQRAGSSVDPRSLAEKVLPGALGQSTRTAIARAESPEQGLALLLVSPEFQRR